MWDTDDLESQEEANLEAIEMLSEVSLMMISFLLPQVQAEHT